MSDIFREEALAELRSRGGPGDVLRVNPRWLVWSFALLLVLVATGAAAALTIPFSEEAHGTAVLGSDGRSLRAVLPLALRDEVRPGAVIRAEFGDTRQAARVTTVQVARGALFARARLALRLRDEVPSRGRASIRIGSETLFDLLRG